MWDSNPILRECCSGLPDPEVHVDYHSAVKGSLAGISYSGANEEEGGKAVAQWYSLTHLPLDKMAAILADDIFRCIFVNEKLYILIKISMGFLPEGLIDNNPSLVLIMAWRQIGDKPLSEPMLTRFTDKYMQH